MKKFFLIAAFLFSCSKNEANSVPNWFSSIKNNDSQFFYGIAVANSLEDATKSALADAASRLISSVSSESNSLSQENNQGIYEENSRKISQIVEKIEFVNYQISNSKKIDSQYFIEVQIPRKNFLIINSKKFENLSKQVADIEKTIGEENIIQKKLSILRALEILKQQEILAKILIGVGEKIDLKNVQDAQLRFNKYSSQLTQSIEFYFSKNDQFSKKLKEFLNKDGLKITNDNSQSKNKIYINYDEDKKFYKLDSTHFVKIIFNFETRDSTHLIASKSLEIKGASIISEDDALKASVANFGEEIEKQGVLKILGIL